MEKQAVLKLVKPALSAALFAQAMAGAFVLPAQADVASESAVLGDYKVTLHLHPFLTDEDLSLLRMVLTDQNALALFVPQEKGFAAMAASPAEGFLTGGAPAASVVALAGLADAASAAKDATGACQAAAKAKENCVLLLEIAPK